MTDTLARPKVRIESDALHPMLSRVWVDDKIVPATEVDFSLGVNQYPVLRITQSADVLIEGRAETRFRVLVPIAFDPTEKPYTLWGEGETLADALEDAAKQLRDRA